MRRVILVIALISSLALFTFGCSGVNIFSNSPARSKILRQTKLSTKYQLYQLEITLSAGAELPIILELSDGDKVDGYYYVEKGDEAIAFNISANNTAMYKSDFKSLPSDTPVSDRFSFTATTALGKSYLLTLANTSNSASKTKSTIYFEVIYPGTNPMFTPLTK